MTTWNRKTAGAGQDTRLTNRERGEVCHPLFRALARLFVSDTAWRSGTSTPWPVIVARTTLAYRCRPIARRSRASGKLCARAKFRRNAHHRHPSRDGVACTRGGPSFARRPAPVHSRGSPQQTPRRRSGISISGSQRVSRGVRSRGRRADATHAGRRAGPMPV
jgi:hypothetical protein